jgi:translation initiation factor 2 subunit 2
MEYEKMLDRLYLSLPKQALTKERFEMPKIDSFLQGPKTQVKNFASLAKTLRRENKELYKFFTKELGVPITIEGERLVINGKFFPNALQPILERYVNEFVLCKECNKPDTHYEDRSGIRVLKCEACGAISAVKHL